MKVGVLTCHRVQNYGSYLQAYALIHVLRKLRCEPLIIDYLYPNRYHVNTVLPDGYPRAKPRKGRLHQLRERFVDTMRNYNSRRGFSFLFWRLCCRVGGLDNNRYLYRYYINLPLTKDFYPSAESLCQLREHFDAVIVGSDQVWNPRWTGEDGSFFLNFLPRKTRRIAYSASFGVDQIGEFYEKLYGAYLLKFHAIAVRESSGVDLVRKTSGKIATHVLDPVQLLSPQEWKMFLPSSPPRKPYVAAYCLRYVFDPYPYAHQLQSDIAMRKGLEMWSLHYSLDENQCKTAKIRTPFEFLSWLIHADFLLLTSFHGVAFAILFNIPFLVITSPSEKKDRRILDVLDLFNLSGRRIDINHILTDDLLQPIDFTPVNMIMKEKHEESMAFLQQALYGEYRARQSRP